MSPSIARIGPYRIFLFASDFVEPPHVHVERDRAVAKFWLDPVGMAYSRLFPGHELRKIEAMVHQHAGEFLEAWDDFFCS